MTVSALDIPLENPLRLVVVDGEMPRDPRDNVAQFDADWFSNYIREWQDKVCYAQKWQFNDKISILLHAAANYVSSGGVTTSTTTVSLKLIDTHGKSWHTWLLQALPANHVIPFGGNVVDALTYYYKNIRLSTISGLPEGIYIFYLTASFDLDGDGTNDYDIHRISEPVSIATKHYNTTHLDWYNTTNTDDIPYAKTGLKFSVRGEFDIVDYAPESIDISYQDGQYNTKTIASQTRRVAKFVTTQRMPEWMIDKIARAWGANKVFWESLGFVKEQGAKWDIGRIPKHPRVTGSLQVTEADKRQGAQQVRVPSVKIFPYGVYPYAVLTPLTMYTDAGDAVIIGPSPIEIIDSTTENALIANYNSSITDEGYNGAFVTDPTSGNLIYVNGSGDAFVGASARVETDYLGFTHGVSVSDPIFFANVDGCIAWGDGSVDLVNWNLFTNSIGHAYPAPATYNVRIYGKYTAIAFSSNWVRNFIGTAGGVLQAFYLYNSSLLSAFDFSVLALANVSLQFIVINSTSLASVTHLNALTLPNINTFSLAQNGLSVTEVSNVLQDIDNMVNGSLAPMNGRQLFLAGQAPAATPNTNGSLAKSDLQSNHGWTVLTD